MSSKSNGAPENYPTFPFALYVPGPFRFRCCCFLKCKLLFQQNSQIVQSLSILKCVISRRFSSLISREKKISFKSEFDLPDSVETSSEGWISFREIILLEHKFSRRRRSLSLRSLIGKCLLNFRHRLVDKWRCEIDRDFREVSSFEFTFCRAAF